MKMVLPEPVHEILKKIQIAGGKGYVVGGALRDFLRGVPQHDWDFATTLSTQEILLAFSGATLVGGVCGTVQVPLEEYGYCEITPCRVESEYSDARHPDTITFVQNIEQDLQRRDFTVNAMAYDGEHLIDLFGGIQDLDNKVLRCVGLPSERFEEDSLRILRLFRFMASLDFAAEPKTLQAAIQAMPRIANLSHERVRTEVNRILLSARPQVLQMVIQNGGLATYGLFGDANLEDLVKVPCSMVERWWALCVLCDADPEELVRHFGFSKKIQKQLEIYTRIYQAGPSKNKVEFKLKLRKYLLNPYCMAQTFAGVNSTFLNEVGFAQQLQESGEPYRIEQLAIDGEMLQRIGIKGVKCGLVLEELQKAVIRKPALNQGIVLNQMAKQYATLL